MTTFRRTATLHSGSSLLLLSATLHNYSAPTIDASYDATIDGAQIGAILRNTSVPTGQIRATGNAHYQQATNRTLIDSLLVKGDLNSRQLNIKTSSIRTQIDNLAAHYSLANGDVILQDLHANLLGGYLTAAGTMSQVTGDSRSTVNAMLHNVSLADLKRSLGKIYCCTEYISERNARNANATTHFGKRLLTIWSRRLTLLFMARLCSSNAKATTAAVPLDSAIHGKFLAKSGELQLSKSFVRTPQTDLTMNGVVSQRSSLDVRLQADDLREIEALADLFRTPTPGQPLQPLGLAGTASFSRDNTGFDGKPIIYRAVHCFEFSCLWNGVEGSSDAGGCESFACQFASCRSGACLTRKASLSMRAPDSRIGLLTSRVRCRSISMRSS